VVAAAARSFGGLSRAPRNAAVRRLTVVRIRVRAKDPEWAARRLSVALQ